ncbi:hydrolase [Teichococcus aestuarii]|uniref:hydrolase n=1 Tax=Teichococcus aestuarii TaxID=568898 RepID=UPI00360FC08F
MGTKRRDLLLAAAMAPLAARLSLPRPALAQPATAAEPPPVLLIHGNGDHAALWMTTLWRFESNGWPRGCLAALNLPDPLARDDDAIPQPRRSGTEDFRRAVEEAVVALRQRTGAARVALVGNSRGGYPIRDFVVHGGGAPQVSHAVLCGTPNRGVYDWEWNRNREFNGRSDFLRRLNGGETDVVPGTAFLTLRSDGNDVYTQSDGAAYGRPGTPTGIDATGPALRGATNLVLGQLDHREVAYHPRAFREIYRFIAGREPERLAIVPEARPVLDGIVSGTPEGVQTNRPLPGATVTVWRTDPESGARTGEALHCRTTSEDGRWGPVAVAPDWTLEFEVAAPGHPVTHFYRSPFPRSSEVVHLRPARPISAEDRAAGAVLLFTRPRGYFARPRDAIILDGREPEQVPLGLARVATVTLRRPVAELGRTVVAQFNEERVAARLWPVAEDRVTVAELTS